MKRKILLKAISLIHEDGFNAFSVRKLSKKLNISTRPIYYYFPNLEGLFADVSTEVLQMLNSFISKKYTSNSYINSGIGYVLFAREHPDYYTILSTPYFWPNQTEDKNDVDSLMKSKATKKELETYEIMKTYTIGMALLASHNKEKYSQDKIIKLQSKLFKLITQK